MHLRTIFGISILLGGLITATAGEKTVVSLRDFKGRELQYAGFELAQPARLHISALGGGGSAGWSYKSDRMFAYGWIIDAESRRPVWEMTASNTTKARGDRSFDGTIALEPGRYEAYFTVYAFAFHTTFTHIITNVDHRRSPLFGSSRNSGRHFFSWLTDWWNDDVADEWNKRAGSWGMDISVDAAGARSITTFTPPANDPAVVLSATNLGDNAFVRQEFSLSAPATIDIRAIGEGVQGAECVDCSWIVDSRTRERVWNASWTDAEPAGGARKNLLSESEVRLEKGTYTLYAITDDSHSSADWNDAPPYDPLHWGVTLSIRDEQERRAFALARARSDDQIIVKLTQMRDNETRSEGFTLKQDAAVRIYAFGERANSRRTMADYATITDAKTREKVWTMDVDRTEHAGGASKNRYIDEVITLPKGSYVVTYVTDDSHAYDDWNTDPPFDKENYGITLSAAGDWKVAGTVSKYVEEKDRNIIAQIIRVREDENRSVRFTIDRSTRVRVYALGEGQGREMFDYGWIEDARTGVVAWEMTYGMTFHAGGGRKNRMVNTSILLDKGDYILRYRTDDSHSYGDWNMDPPDDREYWGITLYREVAPEPPVPPQPPVGQRTP